MSKFGASIARDINRSKCYLRFIAGAAFAAVLSTGVAFAADMPAKSPAAEPAYQWSGCYTGLNAGGGVSASNFTTTVGAGTFLVGSDPATISNDGTGSGSGSNFLGGGQAGCNWQSGTVVAGLEGDFDYYRSNSNFLNKYRCDQFRTLRHRPIAQDRLSGDGTAADRYRR